MAKIKVTFETEAENILDVQNNLEEVLHLDFDYKYSNLTLIEEGHEV